jgi:hypothetical protein
VKIVNLHYQEEVVPIRGAKLLEMIRAGNTDYLQGFGEGDDGVANRLKFREALGVAAEAFIHKQLPDDLREAVEGRTIALDDALKNEKASSAKRADTRMRYLLRGWQQMLPGTLVEFDDQIKGTLKGYVTDVSLPRSADQLTSLGEYRMRVVFPGESRPKTISLATLFNQDKFLSENLSMRIQPDKPDHGIQNWVKREFDKIMSGYNDAPDGMVTRSATVLSGNIFRSVELASNNGLGHPILYTDEQGNRQRAVLVKSHISADKIKSMPMGMDADDVMQYIHALDAKHEARPDKGYKPCAELLIYNNAVMDGPEDGGISIARRSPGQFTMRLPGTKSAAGRLMTDARIFDVGAKTSPDSLRLTLAGNRKTMSCTFDEGKLPELLERLSSGSHVGRFYVSGLDLEIVKQLQQQNRIEAQHTASRDSVAAASMG